MGQVMSMKIFKKRYMTVCGYNKIIRQKKLIGWVEKA
jgi:hypothetical protein